MMCGAPEVLQKMLALRVIVEEDETGGFVAEVPALPGCVSQGESVPRHRTLKPGTLRSLIRNAGLTVEGFVELL